MIAKLLPAVLALSGLGVGAGAGLALRPAPEVEISATEADGHDAAPDRNTSAADHGGARLEAGRQNTGFVEMSKQFVIPVIGEDRIDSLVVASLSLEVLTGTEERVVDRQPKLRDRFLQVLLDHANTGGFQGAFTANGSIDRLRRALAESGSQILGPDLVDVLILDLNRQDA